MQENSETGQAKDVPTTILAWLIAGLVISIKP